MRGQCPLKEGTRHRDRPRRDVLPLVMPEESKKDNDWKRYAKQPQQCASTKAHSSLLSNETARLTYESWLWFRHEGEFTTRSRWPSVLARYRQSRPEQSGSDAAEAASMNSARCAARRGDGAKSENCGPPGGRGSSVVQRCGALLRPKWAAKCGRTHAGAGSLL